MIVCAVVTAVAGILRAALAFTRAFDPDEFQHLHGGWCLAHGLWPYRDYFEHHTPWLHLAMAPFFALGDVDRRPDDAVAFVFGARAAMWGLATLAIALTFRLGRAWAGARVGWVAAALLSTTLVFVDKTLEIRPDVPAVACLLGSWLMLLDALRGDPVRQGRWWRPFASGALFGAAILFTQKALFAGPGTAVVLLWWAVDRRQAGSFRDRAAPLVAFAAGALAPMAATLALFAAHTGVAAFFESNFLLNAAWRVRFPPRPIMRRIVVANPVLAVLALDGLVRAAARLSAPAAVTRGDALVVAQVAGLVAGAFVIPIPLPQYFVMVLPVAALLAARSLVGAAEAIGVLLARRAAPWPAAVATVLIGGLVVALAPPLVGMASALDPARPEIRDQLDRLRLVLATTASDDTVMDGFTGAGAFRPHAYHYFFLHHDVRALLGEPDLRRLRAELRDGDIAPAVVLFDEDMRALPAEITAFLEENYEPSEDPLVWRSKDLALDRPEAGGRLDVGSGPTDVLVGRGWSPPLEEDGRSVRRTQGQRSTLRVPLRQPADLVVTVRARPEDGAGALRSRLALAVNGTRVGDLPLAPGWEDYAFPVPASRWRRGVNSVRLTLGPVPVDVDYLDVRKERATDR